MSTEQTVLLALLRYKKDVISLVNNGSFHVHPIDIVNRLNDTIKLLENTDGNS